MWACRARHCSFQLDGGNRTRSTVAGAGSELLSADPRARKGGDDMGSVHERSVGAWKLISRE